MARGRVAGRWVISRRASWLSGLVLASMTLFLGLALLLRGAAGLPLDLAATAAVQEIRLPLFHQLMVAITELGYFPWSTLVAAGASGGAWRGGFRREALFIVVALGVSPLVSAIKLLVERPRPGADVVSVVGHVLEYSYPSGHVATFVGLYGFLFFLVFVLAKRSAGRTAVLWVLGLLVGLVGVSRVYLGHHWASDVVGGYALGTAYLVLLIQLYRYRGRARALNQPADAAQADPADVAQVEPAAAAPARR